MKIKIILPDKRIEECKFHHAMTVEDIIHQYQKNCPYEILGCKVNHLYKRIDTVLDDDSLVELFDIRDPYANLSYQLSLTLLYLTAVRKVLGKNANIRIANSLSKGVFTTIQVPHLSEEMVKEIEMEMHRLQKEDVPIKEERKTREEMLYRFEKNANHEEKALFDSAYDLDHCYLCSLKEETEIFYQHLLPSTKYLRLFELRKYRHSVLLRFPHSSDPNVIPTFAEQQLLYDAFSEETHWEHLVGVNTASQLNERILKKDTLSMILLSEALHEKRIAEIASMIREKNKRIILIAGPSSSGKTSFAKRLCIQLSVVGLKPLYLGTDDYFKNREDNVPGPDGKIDFEALSAVDVDLFMKQMNDLLAGKTVDIPEFDFVTGEKIFGKRITSIDDKQPIVIEGIHGLNPALTSGIAEDEKFRIYISPLTSLNLDRYHRVPTTDARMLRRMVRDNRVRARTAADTIRDWPSVRHGEDHYIFPYNDQADIFFNSQCIYELAVLKKYAEPLLKAIPYQDPEYGEAQRMLDFLKFFVPIDCDEAIPNHSLLREFIGGSVLVK